MKHLLLLLVTIEIVIVAGAISFCGINRGSASVAYHEWKQNPSEMTEKKWKDQSLALRKDNIIIDVAFFSFLTVNTGALIWIIFSFRRKKNAMRLTNVPPNPPAPPDPK